MPSPLTNIYSAKEAESTFQPLLLADFLFVDGSELHLSTHPLSAAEGGFAFAGVDYQARLSSQSISEITMLSQQGISIIPSVSLVVEDADAQIYSGWETAVGFRGAILTLTLIFHDVGANSFSSDARFVFAGICEKAAINATVTTVVAFSEIGKKILPAVLLQRTCPWANPVTVAQRATADNVDSIYFRCGETRDPATAPPCQHTTATCTRPLRRANITWDPINQQFVKTYTTGQTSLVINTLSGGIIGQPIPILYGTGWIAAKPIATIGDGNYTRFETAAALGPLNSITKFVVAGEELSPANDLDGNSYSYANKDFRYNCVNNGRRDGSPNADVPWSGNGDPYGSIAAFEAVVPKDVAAANAPPSCQILARGGSVRKFQQIASITVSGGVATATLVGANTDIASNSVFPFTISGNSFSAVNGDYTSLTMWTYGPPGTIQFPCASGAGTGTGGYIRYSQYTENPVWIYMDLRVKGGDDYSQYNMATACAAALVCDQPITVQGSTAIFALAFNPGDTVVDVLSTDGFPASGRVLIDSDVLAYTGIGVHFDGTHYIPQLTGVSHYSGTSATHAIGATVKDTVSATTRARYSTNLVITEKRAVPDILRGIQAATNMIVNRNTSTGLYEIYIEDTLHDSQPAAIDGSNYNTAVSGLDKNGDVATGYAAYRFDELTDILAGSNGGSTLEEQARGVNDFPNKLQFNFADSAYTYAQSSITVDDIDDVYRIGQEVPGSPSTMPEGITSYDQALCQARLILAKSLHGNEAGDGRGTRTFKFKTTFKAVHLRVGHIVLLNSARLGITDQPFRVTAIQPTTNWEEATISIAWHEDLWYTLGYGRKLPEVSGNRRLTQASKTPMQWTANQDAASSDAVLPTGYKTFGLSSTYSANADGSQAVRISATGEQIVNQFSALAQAPIVDLVPTVATTGGSIRGGQSFYLAIAAKDAGGLLSPLSSIVRADVASGSANTITLPVTSWPGTVSGYCIYAGQTAQRLTLQVEASGTPASVTIAAFTAYGESAPDGSFDHLEADACLCLSNGVAIGQASATATSSTVTFTGTPFAGLTLTGRIASVVAADADTRVRNFTITGNTDSTLTFATTPDILANDWVCVRSLVTVSGLTVSDPLWSFTASALVGKVLRTIAGSGTPQYRTIMANTPTSITIGADWTYPIDSTSIMIIEEPSVLTTVRTSRLSTNTRASATSIDIDLKNYPGRFVRVTCYAADGRNTRAAEALALTRDLYIAGAAGAAVPPAGVPSLITSFDMSYEIEGTSTQGGGVWLWTGSAWSRTGDSAHAIGDAHTGVQSIQWKFTVGVPTDPNTAGVWIVHSRYPDGTYGTPFISTESGWFGNGWGIVCNNQPPQGAPFTTYGSWIGLGSWADTGGTDYEEFTAWTYNRNPNPDHAAPTTGSSLIIKAAFPAGYQVSGSTVPLALPTDFNAVQELEGASGQPAIGTASPGVQSVRFKFRAVIPAEPDGGRTDIMHALYTSSGYSTIITDVSGPGWGPDGWGRVVDGIPPRSLVGTCNVSGTALTWVSGDHFTADLTGREILLNGTTPIVVTYVSSTSLTLASSGGTLTGAAFAMLWTTHTGWITVPSTITYQGFRPRSIGPDGAVLDPTGGALQVNITTAASTGIAPSGINTSSNALLYNVLNLQLVPLLCLADGTAKPTSTGFILQSKTSGPRIVIDPAGVIQLDDGVSLATKVQLTASGLVIQGPATSSGILIQDATGAHQVKVNNAGVMISDGTNSLSLGASGAQLSGPGGSTVLLGATSASLQYGLTQLNLGPAVGASLLDGNASLTCLGGDALVTTMGGGDITLQCLLGGNITLNCSGGVGGTLSLSGTAYSIANPSTFRTAIGAAASGANSDITSASALVTLGASTVAITYPPRLNGTQPAGGSVTGTLANFPAGTTSGNPSAFIEVILNNGTHAIIPAWNLAW